MFGIGRPLLLTVVLAVCGTGQVCRGQQDDNSYWNKVYRTDQAVFVHRPTDLLVSAVKGRPAGKALDIGMGQGRNSIFLAQQGWEVTGFDPSEEGVRQARERAAKLGLHLRALVAREEDFDLRTEQWDLIVMTYVRRLRAGDADRFARALRPQGIFVYENNNVGKQNELLGYFLAWRILHFEDLDTSSDWHPERTQRLERLVAVKPAAH
ncbi:MAG TPA: class I SAM-dependent methyltransferase [Terriglobia bacterium]|nr:class I SAM-dependent methyltransferase [Terriglobia bacterium]